jgi:hypothetical protein
MKSLILMQISMVLYGIQREMVLPCSESVSSANENKESHVIHYLKFYESPTTKAIVKQYERLPINFQVPTSFVFFQKMMNNCFWCDAQQ